MSMRSYDNERVEEIIKERDALRAENERLKLGLEELRVTLAAVDNSDGFRRRIDFILGRTKEQLFRPPQRPASERP